MLQQIMSQIAKKNNISTYRISIQNQKWHDFPSRLTPRFTSPNYVNEKFFIFLSHFFLFMPQIYIFRFVFSRNMNRDFHADTFTNLSGKSILINSVATEHLIIYIHVWCYNCAAMFELNSSGVWLIFFILAADLLK